VFGLFGNTDPTRPPTMLAAPVIPAGLVKIFNASFLRPALDKFLRLVIVLTAETAVERKPNGLENAVPSATLPNTDSSPDNTPP
jgi:hypothetical protein